MRVIIRAVFVTALVALSGFVGAQTANPLTISGSVEPTTQLSLADGSGYANLSSGPGGRTFIRFSDKISQYSNLVIRFGAPYLDDRSGSSYNSTITPTGFPIANNSWNSGVGIQDAYASTDILGELGMNQLIGLKLQAGMFHLRAPTFSRGLNFGLGTGEDNSRSEIYTNYTFSYPGSSYESYKWSLEVPVNAWKDSFPLSVRVGSDLDLSGRNEATGFTGYAEATGRNLYLFDDLFVVDWAAYYTLKARDAAPSGTPYIQNGNIFGLELATGFGFDNGISIGLGANADYAVYDYQAQWSGTATLRNYNGEGSLNFEAGADVTAKDWAKVYGAWVHRNYFNLDVTTANPGNWAQNYAAARLDVLLVKTLTPYVGGSYVVSYDTIKDPYTHQLRGSPSNGTPLSWEAGLMWALTKSVQLDVGYTKGNNSALTNFGSVINAIQQDDGGAAFFRGTWKF